MNVTCISSSNILHQKEGTSYRICKMISDSLRSINADIDLSIIELKNYDLSPCIGCGKCYETKRCSINDNFNNIYNKLVDSDIVFIVSPHYAPIPAKLCMLLEKMEQISFLHWGKDNAYKSEMFGKIAGIISHGGGAKWALKSYKLMVNDTIANALDTIQIKVVPYNEDWKTGISLPVKNIIISDNNIFPIQEYDFNYLYSEIQNYIEKVIEFYNNY